MPRNARPTGRYRYRAHRSSRGGASNRTIECVDASDPHRTWGLAHSVPERPQRAPFQPVTATSPHSNCDGDNRGQPSLPHRCSLIPILIANWAFYPDRKTGNSCGLGAQMLDLIAGLPTPFALWVSARSSFRISFSRSMRCNVDAACFSLVRSFSPRSARCPGGRRGRLRTVLSMFLYLPA